VTRERSRLSSFYSIPAVKFSTRMIMQTLNFVLYISVIITLKNPEQMDEISPRLPQIIDEIGGGAKQDGGAPWELLWVVFEVGFWLDRLYARFLRYRLNAPPTTGIQASLVKVELAADIFVIIGLGSRMAMLYIDDEIRADYGNDYDCTNITVPCVNGSRCVQNAILQLSMPAADQEVFNFADVVKDSGCGSAYDTGRLLYEVFVVMISLKVILIIFLLMPYFSENKSLGVLILIVSEMLGDIAQFIVIFLAVTLGFSMALVGLQQIGWFQVLDGTNNFHPIATYGAFWAPYWGVYGESVPEQYNWLGSMLIWSYMFLASIGLVNLLVAMFSDTFTRVKTASEVEYVFHRCSRLYEYRHILLTTPPVLNAPYVLFFFSKELVLRFSQFLRLASQTSARGFELARRTTYAMADVSARHRPSFRDSRARPPTIRKMVASNASDQAPEMAVRQPSSASSASGSRETNMMDGKLLVGAYLRERKRVEDGRPEVMLRKMAGAMTDLRTHLDDDRILFKARFSAIESRLDRMQNAAGKKWYDFR